eukprot:6203180-Pleurochrysis_carterae.AAC.2
MYELDGEAGLDAEFRQSNIPGRWQRCGTSSPAVAPVPDFLAAAAVGVSRVLDRERLLARLS